VELNEQVVELEKSWKSLQTILANLWK
jgi:hypothetical protein